MFDFTSVSNRDFSGYQFLPRKNIKTTYKDTKNQKERKNKHRSEAALCRHFREDDKKAALSSEIRNYRSKPRINKSSTTCRIRSETK